MVVRCEVIPGAHSPIHETPPRHQRHVRARQSRVDHDGDMPERPDLKVGVSRSLLGSECSWPVHGLRHPPESGTSGWFCWTGDLSEDSDFFVPIHLSHLVERLPELADFLDLPPGSRFLVAPDYVDVWEDDSLLDL